MSPADDDSVAVVLVTAPDPEVGAAIGRDLVERRLAACVNLVGPIRSIYRWEGALQDDSEVLLVIKTRGARREEVSERVQSLHPYDVPEVLALPVGGGSEAYLRWVLGETAP